MKSFEFTYNNKNCLVDFISWNKNYIILHYNYYNIGTTKYSIPFYGEFEGNKIKFTGLLKPNEELVSICQKYFDLLVFS